MLSCEIQYEGCGVWLKWLYLGKMFEDTGYSEEVVRVMR